MERLRALKEKTEAVSYAEVLKNALRLYDEVIRIHEEGKTLAIKDDKGKVTEYRVFV